MYFMAKGSSGPIVPISSIQIFILIFFKKFCVTIFFYNFGPISPIQNSFTFIEFSKEKIGIKKKLF